MKTNQKRQGYIDHWEFDAKEANDAHAEASGQEKVVVEAYGDMVNDATIVANEGLHRGSRDKRSYVQR